MIVREGKVKRCSTVKACFLLLIGFLRSVASEVGLLPLPQQSTESATVEGYVHLDAAMLNLTKYVGETVRIRCEITGFPLPRYRWRHDGVIIAESGDADRSRRDVKTTHWGSRLKIEDLTVNDSGTYSCEGLNGFGRQTTTGNMDILPGPNPNKENSRIRFPQQDFNDDDDELSVMETGLDVRYDEMDEQSRREDGRMEEEERRGGAGGEEKRKNNHRWGTSNKMDPGDNERSCQRYHGNLCSKFLSNRSKIYVAEEQSHQSIIETSLAATLTLIASSNDVTQECLDFALPLLCRLSFPECDSSRSKSSASPRLCSDECKHFTQDVCREPYRLVTEHNPTDVPLVLVDCQQMANSDRSQCLSVTSLERRHDNRRRITTLYIVILSVGLPLFVAIATVLSVLCCRCSRSKDSIKKSSPEFKGHEASPILSNPVRRTLSEVAPDDVIFLNELGEGAYGKLYIGSVCTESSQSSIPTFIKVLSDRSDPSLQEMVRQEAMRLIDINHPNIVRIFGLALGGTSKPTCMLYEHMESLDLRHYLMMSLSEEDSTGRFEMNDRIRVTIIRQVASAAEYLISSGLIHRDIAARNVLVGKSMLVKLSDFGLCRYPYEDDYYLTDDGSMIPVRWMSPEALLQGQYSEASDIWAFGVLVWEMYNPGSRPYLCQSDEDVIDLLRNRKRWSVAWSRQCPPQIGALVSECWNDQPYRRPHFKDVLEMMSQLDSSGDIEGGQFGGDCGRLDDTPTGSNNNTASTNVSPTLPFPLFSQQSLYHQQPSVSAHSIQCYTPLIGSPTFMGPSNRYLFNRFPYSSTPNSPVKASPFPTSGNSKYWYHWSPPTMSSGVPNLV